MRSGKSTDRAYLLATRSLIHAQVLENELIKHLGEPLSDEGRSTGDEDMRHETVNHSGEE